jgi:hypothetical protein
VTDIFQVVDLGDGRMRVDVHVNGRILPVILDAPPGAGRMKYLQLAVDEAMAKEELKQLRATLKEAEERLDELTTTTGASPPMIAEFFISFLAPTNTAQVQLGDLQEMFHKNVERLGEKQARRKYWMQVAASLAPLLWQWLKRVGFFTIVVDYFRSKTGL